MREGKEKNEIWADVQNENLINNGYVKNTVQGLRHRVALLNWRKMRKVVGSMWDVSSACVKCRKGNRGEIQREREGRKIYKREATRRSKERRSWMGGGGWGRVEGWALIFSGFEKLPRREGLKIEMGGGYMRHEHHISFLAVLITPIIGR